jgi:hypothetical protein
MLTATAPRITPDEAQLAKRVREALGPYAPPALGADENAACVTVWSVRELQDVYARVGGTVAARQVVRRFEDAAYTVIELLLVAELDGIGTVAVNTDWDPADEPHGFTLPVVQAAAA